MNDIVKRLRAVENGWETTHCYNGLRIEAADEIERLLAEIAKAREMNAEARKVLARCRPYIDSGMESLHSAIDAAMEGGK